MKNNTNSISYIRYLLLYLPVWLLIFQSFLKTELITFFERFENVMSPFIPINIYWLLRLALFAYFIVALIFFTENNIQQTRLQKSLSYEREGGDPLLTMRAVACVNVIMGHWFLVVYGPSTPAVGSVDYILRVVLSFSPWCGVWIFFTLSGYLIGKGFATGRHTIQRDGLLRYYYNRIRRIFPVYFTSIFLVAILMRPEFLDWTNPINRNSFFEAITFDQQGGGVIGALWSISTEFQFYMLAPFLYLIISSMKLRVKALVFISIMILAALALIKFLILKQHPHLWHSRVYFPLLLNLDCFLAGMVMSIVVNQMREKDVYISHGLALGFLILLVSQVIYSVWSFNEMASYAGVPGSSTRIYYLTIGPAVTIFLTCCALLIFELTKKSEVKEYNAFWNLSTFLGLITYCLYVLHEPVYLSIRKIFPINLSIYDSLAYFPVGLGLSVSLAAIVYFFIEKYFDKISYQEFFGRIK